LTIGVGAEMTVKKGKPRPANARGLRWIPVSKKPQQKTAQFSLQNLLVKHSTQRRQRKNSKRAEQPKQRENREKAFRSDEPLKR
jgi:hypothetical protein